MGAYAASFVPGLQDVVGSALKQQCPDVELRHLLDGFVVFDTAAPVDTLKRLRFVNNLFGVIRTFPKLPGDPVHAMLKAVADPHTWRGWDLGHLAGRTCRLIASQEGRFVSADPRLLRAAEDAVARHTRLRFGRARPDTEFWVLARREGLGLFLQRLTTHASFDKLLQRGELRPDLCHALCLLSEPSDDDVFLDPFCGHGAIPVERARSWPFRLIFATDSDPAHVRRVRQKVKATRKPRIIRSFITRTADALDLRKLDDRFVTRIVTDPPWGLYDAGPDLRDFYTRMLREFARVLAPGGIAVILTAAKDALADALAGTVALNLSDTLDILVSGKKATVHRLARPA